MQVDRRSGISPAGFSAAWVNEKGELAPYVKGPNHGLSCGCASHLAFEPSAEAHARAAAAHAALVNSPEAVRAGVSASLGHTFDYDALAAAVRASLGTYVAADTTNPP